MTDSSANPSALLPHGPEMQYVRRVLKRDEHTCLCSARFEADNPFATNGTVPAFVAVEAIAQTSAVHEASWRWTDSGTDDTPFTPRIGYLVSANELTFSIEPIPVEHDFETRVTLVTRVGPLAEYRVEARSGDTVFVEGIVKTFATNGDEA